ncbi:hypothetical protein GIB67_010260 [Kingdonia uniflora]|uniref:Nucleolus and neural progenitor protein-like N-terminal domain-containing protein n=1 Tax=Kingdonia uniflora TaxID=39325 RepID=A0A7J7NB90_9MAGN|nr:hypothetical protein GIB67_010260 [Kingdonia uniflora]
MGSESINFEERLNSLLSQLQTESGILSRIVYKGKNQHRRSIYFQYLLKVRRDVRLLQSARLDEILKSIFQVVNGKPKQIVHFLESLKKRRNNKEKYNLMERLLGVARLLSQMVDPMVKTAIEISSLLARSFFMGFSVTILALIARLRVLVQQILLHVVSVFNMVTSLSQKEQTVKLNCGGIEAIREYYPLNEEVQILECVWETDKFVLHENVKRVATVNQDEHLSVGIDAPLQSSNVSYQTIEAFLGDDEHVDTDNSLDDLFGPTNVKRRKFDASAVQPVEGATGVGRNEDNADQRESNDTDEGIAIVFKCPSPSPKSLENQSESRKKVAFMSVRKPTPLKNDKSGYQKKFVGADCLSSSPNNKGDSFFNLLTGGDMKDSLF